MIASGWQTIPPQKMDSEVVVVVKSVCPPGAEAPPRGFNLRSAAMSIRIPELPPHLALGIIYAASVSPAPLSAPSGSFA